MFTPTPFWRYHYKQFEEIKKTIFRMVQRVWIGLEFRTKQEHLNTKTNFVTDKQVQGSGFSTLFNTKEEGGHTMIMYMMRWLINKLLHLLYNTE